MLKVKALRENVKELKYGSNLASGFDIRAYDCVMWNKYKNELQPVSPTARNGKLGWIIPPYATVIFKTGYSMACEVNEEIQVRARSGYSLKTPMRISNAVGTIDADFRGEVGVIMDNISSQCHFVEFEERVAQCIVCPIHRHEVVVVDDLDSTERGEGGFGSTGIN